MNDVYELGLHKNPANHVALSPLTFLERAGTVYRDRLAVVHGTRRLTWGQVFARARRLASALEKLGIKKGDTVAVMLPNTPPMVEVHFGVPAMGAVLNTLNTRLDADAIGFMLDHGEAKVVLVDAEYAEVVRVAVAKTGRDIIIIDVDDDEFIAPKHIGVIEYEALLATGDPDQAWRLPDDEWDAISLNYTSGTTGNPKGVVYHHRGAHQNAVSNILEWDMPHHAVYLWTLPMFHCNGWCFPWTMAARAGVNVCLRKVEPKAVFDLIRAHRVTHYCGAPIVHASLVNAPAELRAGIDWRVSAMVAGAAPPAAMIEGMRASAST